MSLHYYCKFHFFNTVDAKETRKSRQRGENALVCQGLFLLLETFYQVISRGQSNSRSCWRNSFSGFLPKLELLPLPAWKSAAFWLVRPYVRFVFRCIQISLVCDQQNLLPYKYTNNLFTSTSPRSSFRS